MMLISRILFSLSSQYFFEPYSLITISWYKEKVKLIPWISIFSFLSSLKFSIYFQMRLPGVEPGSIAWKAIILTVGLQTLDALG